MLGYTDIIYENLAEKLSAYERLSREDNDRIQVLSGGNSDAEEW